MFYENLKQACSKNGTTVTELLKKLGMSSGNTGRWKSGGTPSIDVIKKISNELNVSVDQLLGKETTTIDQQLEGEDFALWGEVKELTTEEKTDVLNFINFIKSKRK